MKQTAVEWLEIEIVKLENKYGIPGEIYQLCEKAKEMEKQQIINAVNFGDERGKLTTYLTAEQYYNETFKSE